MFTSKKFWIILITLIGIMSITAVSNHYAHLPENLSQHETIVLGQSQLVPGSQAAMRVAVRDSSDSTPIATAAVEVILKAPNGDENIVYEGTTNELGTANVSFTVPDDENDYTLIVNTQSPLGDDRVEQALTLKRDYRILLSTDKPLYQPGQEIHLRALALNTFDLTPAAGQEMELIIADGKGNTVHRETQTTSEFGVAFTDFQLADQVNSGAYKITAVLHNTTSEKTVTVEPYVLPKFAVNLSTDKPYYQPGAPVKATLDATYFFGKPVNNANIEIEGFTFDVARQDLFTLQGTTDDTGQFDFEFDLPETLIGSDLEGGMGTFYLQARVTDQTNHSESGGRTFPVTASSLIIEAIPEGGQLKPGIENILYVLTSYPDGNPAPTSLTITFPNQQEIVEVATGEYGLAEVAYTPQNGAQNFNMTAQDEQGNQAQQSFNFASDQQEESILLRPDRPAYQIGETMTLNIFSSASSGTAYLDIVREGQTVSTRAVKIEAGQAQVAVDMTPDLFGTLELHAYKILSSGTIVRDTRIVLVDQADDLAMTFMADKEVYRPGETAVLDIDVTGQDGTGTHAAIGLAVVDEAVFVLSEQDPGFAKLYFMLEQELLQPKYELHGFSVPDLLTSEPVTDSQLRHAQEGAAQASLAEAALNSPTFSLTANSHDENMAEVQAIQSKYFQKLSNFLFALLLLIPLVAGGITAVYIWHSGNLNEKVKTTAIIFLTTVVIAGFSDTAQLLNDYFLLLLFLAIFLIPMSIGLLIIHAWQLKDSSLGWILGLIPLYLCIMFALFLVQSNGYFHLETASKWFAPPIFLLLPLSFLLRSADFLYSKKRLHFGATIIVAFISLAIVLSACASQAEFAQPQTVEVTRVVTETIAGIGEVEFEAPTEEEAPAEEEAMADTAVSTNDTQSSEPPRLRQYFPETMLWLPDGETDNNGQLTLDIPVADSITTWRLTALASTQDGRLGSGTSSLRVFQDFFIDLDLPTALTVGDEVSIPVGVFNYLPEAQAVTLQLQPEAWFQLLDEPEKTITVEPNEITVVYFRVKAQEFGNKPFQVTAIGAKMSDAILKQVHIYPNGKEIFFTESGRMSAEEAVNSTIAIPNQAIAGSPNLTIKVYPGLVSQVVEGLDSLFRMPGGCFEQTSSTTYPNVLALNYLLKTDQVAPEVQFKAEDYINLGYQRLTTFEVGNQSGAFSLFGNPPPDPMLTAYGLQEFADMRHVHNVDPALIQRMGRWLLSIQAEDGSWSSSAGFRESNITRQIKPIPVTAYVVWSLSDAGFVQEQGTQRGVSYLREQLSNIEDPYELSLVANALVAYDQALGQGLQDNTRSVLDLLAEYAVVEAESASWGTNSETVMGSYGAVGSIETTALATLAYLRSDYRPDLAHAGLNNLIAQKDNAGNWHTTQTTILALKSFITAAEKSSQNLDATVTITLNDGQTRSLQVNQENFDVVQMVTFNDLPAGTTVVAIQVEGEGKLMYQITGSYYLPYDALANYPDLMPKDELVDITVHYDRTELAMNDSVQVDVSVKMNVAEGSADWAMVDLGIPPGFSVNREDLNALITQSSQQPADYLGTTIEKYELTGRQLILYLGHLNGAESFDFSYRMTAKYPLKAQTPASTAYDYYNPSVNGESYPVLLTVVEK